MASSLTSCAIKDETSLCLADNATTHTTLKNQKYFSHLLLAKANVNTISGASDLIKGSARANIMLPNGTQLIIDDAMFSSRSTRNLLSFKDIRKNGYHIETTNKNDEEFLYITSVVSGVRKVMKKLPSYKSGLYYTFINPVESYMVMNKKLSDPTNLIIWHDCLGHPGSTMMRRIIENSNGHPLKNKIVPLSKDLLCVACFQGKLIIRPSPVKVAIECPNVLDRI
ncbi:uncharacterized protein LOC141673737 [Apium graveolens]|uniref:uncharacterized protein LOC141673737 n=1 Tax=Apium graveolens TaxID=4045 RepID=UPI003D7A6468